MFSIAKAACEPQTQSDLMVSHANLCASAGWGLVWFRTWLYLRFSFCLYFISNITMLASGLDMIALTLNSSFKLSLLCKDKLLFLGHKLIWYRENGWRLEILANAIIRSYIPVVRQNIQKYKIYLDMRVEVYLLLVDGLKVTFYLGNRHSSLAMITGKRWLFKKRKMVFGPYE